MKHFPTAIILLLVLCMIPIAYAQEKIQVYEREFPTSMADLGIHGPVKMVKATLSAPIYDLMDLFLFKRQFSPQTNRQIYTRV